MTFFFSNNNNLSQIKLTSGIIFLDWAQVSNNCIKPLELSVTWMDINGIRNGLFSLRDFYSYREDINKFRVDFLKKVGNKCWINVEVPTKISFSINGLDGHFVELSYFIMRE